MTYRFSDLEAQVERMREQLPINSDPEIKIAQWGTLGGVAMPLNGLALGSEAAEAIEEQGEPADPDEPETIWLITGLTSLERPYDVPSAVFDLAG